MYFAKLIILSMLVFPISKARAFDYFANQKEYESKKRYVIIDMDSYIMSGKLFAPKSVKLFQSLSRDKNVILHYKAEDPGTLLKLKKDYPGISKLANSTSKIKGETSDFCSKHITDFAYIKSRGLERTNDGACSRGRVVVDLSSNQFINTLATKLHQSLVFDAQDFSFIFAYRLSLAFLPEHPGNMFLESNIPLGLIPELTSDKKHCYLYDKLLDEDLSKLPMRLCVKYLEEDLKKHDPVYVMMQDAEGADECYEINLSKFRNKVDKYLCQQNFHAIRYKLLQACIKANECRASGILHNINSLGPAIDVLKKLINEAESIGYESGDWTSKRSELLKSLDQIDQRLSNCFSTIFETKVAFFSNPPTELQQDYKKALDNLVDIFSKDLKGALGSNSLRNDLIDNLLARFNQCGEEYFNAGLLNRKFLHHCADKAKVQALHQIVSGLKKDDAMFLDTECHDLSNMKEDTMDNYNVCTGSLVLLKKFERVKDLAKKLKVDMAKNIYEEFNKCIKNNLGTNSCSTLVLGSKALLNSREVTKAFIDIPQIKGIVYRKEFKERFEKCLSKADGGDKINEIEVDSCINSYKTKLVTFMEKANFSASQKAVLSLASELNEYKKTLSRDTNVFHWTKSRAASFSSSIYARAMTNLFSRNIDLEKNVIGKGLYAATDPTITKKYGDKLLRLNLKKGGSFLDLRETGCPLGQSFYISHESRKLMENAGCSIISKNNCYERIYFNKSKSNKCNDLLIGAIEELDLSFIAYRYKSLLPDFCKNDPRVAFVMVKTPQVQSSYDVNEIFAAGGSSGAVDINRMGNRKYEKYSELTEISNHHSKFFKDIPKKDEKTLCDKWGSRLFGCNCREDKTYQEDQVRKDKRKIYY